MNALLASHQRWAHLDFHTSPLIPDVGCESGDARVCADDQMRAHQLVVGSNFPG